MLIRKHDAAQSDEEWKNLLKEQDFGQLISPGRDRDLPIIVPTHFVFDGEATIELHLARANPIWEALEENPLAVMSVASADMYIPTQVNETDSTSRYGVPTSYYAAVQAAGECALLDGPELAEILRHQLAHFQPEGGYERVEAGDNPYGRQFGAIRGIRLDIREVRAKFKFGGNKTIEHQVKISDWLSRQPGPRAAQARGHQLRRLKAKQQAG